MERNYLLDGMRGIAAIAVVAMHIGTTLRIGVGPGAYLAVDFFFALSGFVITRAYTDRLAADLGWWRFIRLRLVRLYPLFALGMAFGVVKSMSQTFLDPEHALSAVKFTGAVVLNALMLPVPFDYPILFPFNAPAWSLFDEMAINIVFAIMLFRLRSNIIVPLVVLTGAAMIGIAFESGRGLDVGAIRETIHFGLVRVTYSFCLGMIIARHFGSSAPRLTRGALLLLVPMLLFFFLPASGAGIPLRDLMFALLVSPLILFAGATRDAPVRFRRILALLGDVSYPLYAIHNPIQLAVSFVGIRLHLPAALTFALALGVSLVAAWMAAHFYDRPVRAWLSQRLHQRQSAPPQLA